ncbi:MAG TPA: GNAT family N-acetyltransferase [Acidimicrobiales bacterium]|nr:GNAT family N-acetyltransferase [Acidimicrobiales bacterium]
MNVVISEATVVDDDLVAAFARLIPQLSSSNPAPDRNALAAIVDNPDVFLFLARDADDAKDDERGRIIGSLTLVTFRIPTGLRAWIEDVVVDDAIRRSGAATKLTTTALAKAKELGVATVDLTSRPSREAANALYQKLGFELRNSNLYRYAL